MRVLIQRVKSASVAVEGKVIGAIGPGLLVFAGFTHGDDAAAVAWMCEKVARLRIFEDAAGKMNRSVAAAGGGILVVPQFTLYADASKGNRPSFTDAALPEVAGPLYEEMIRRLKESSGVPVETGSFRAEMAVALVNDGPVTILLDRDGATRGSPGPGPE